MKRPPNSRLSLIAIAASILLVVVGLVSVGVTSKRAALASSSAAVTSLELVSENSLGVVGPTRDKITVVTTRESSTISDSMTIVLSVEPQGAAHFYPLELGQEFLPGAQLILGTGVEKIDFFIEWREAGSITISAVDETESLDAVSKVFTIEAAPVPTETPVPSSTKVAEEAEPDLVPPDSADDTGTPPDEPNLTPPNISDDTGTSEPVLVPPDSTDDTGTSTLTIGPDNGSSVSTAGGAHDSEIRLAASTPEGDLYFNAGGVLTGLKIELSNSDGAAVNLYMFEGKTLASLWVLDEDGKPNPAKLVIPAGESVAVVSLTAQINQAVRSVKLCASLDGVTVTDECDGIDIPVLRELVIEESPGGATFGWDRDETAVYEIALMADPITEFTAVVDDSTAVRTSGLTESLNGVWRDEMTPECRPDNDPECRLRVWFDAMTVSTTDQQFTVEVRIRDRGTDTSKPFAAGKIGTIGEPSEPAALTAEVSKPSEGESVWSLSITPSNEDGGLDQSLLIRYRTSNSDKWVRHILPFNVWQLTAKGYGDGETIVTWNDFKFTEGESLEAVEVIPFNAAGPGAPHSAAMPKGSTLEWLTGGGWLLVLGWFGGTILFVAFIWAFWKFAQVKRNTAWLNAVLPERDPGERQDERSSLSSYVRNPSEAGVQEKSVMAAAFVDAAYDLLAAQHAKTEGLNNKARLSIANFVKQYGVTQASEISSGNSNLIEIRNTTISARTEQREAEDALERTRDDLSKLSAERESVMAGLNEAADNLANLKSEIARQENVSKDQITKLTSRVDQEKVKLGNQLKVLHQRIDGSKAERTQIEKQGYEDLVDSAMAAVSSESALEAMSGGGRVLQKADLNELVKRLSELQDDGLVFATQTRPGDFTMTYPAVNDLAGMRKLVEGSIRAFGAWIIASIPIELERDDSESFDPDEVERTAELKDLDKDFGVVGFGLASGLERVFDLVTERLSDQSGTDDRIRQYDQPEFLDGAAQAVETLLSSNLNVVYPEFYEVLGLEEGEVEGLRVGTDDRGPADALAIYVVNDWFRQLSDDVVKSQAQTTLAEMQRLQNDQQLTAYGFKNIVMANLQTRWSFRDDESWSPSTISGFSVICDYIVRYIHADSRSSWS